METVSRLVCGLSNLRLTERKMWQIARVALSCIPSASENQTDETTYWAAVKRRDELIAGLDVRGKANAKLAYGCLDRILNPVRVR